MGLEFMDTHTPCISSISELCEQCEDSKNSYTVELEELRRQLRQVGRNHYNPRLSLASREFNMAGSDNNRSSIRQLRPRRVSEENVK